MELFNGVDKSFFAFGLTTKTIGGFSPHDADHRMGTLSSMNFVKLTVNVCSLLNPGFGNIGVGKQSGAERHVAERQVRICLSLLHALDAHVPSQAI